MIRSSHPDTITMKHIIKTLLPLTLLTMTACGDGDPDPKQPKDCTQSCLSDMTNDTTSDAQPDSSNTLDMGADLSVDMKPDTIPKEYFVTTWTTTKDNQEIRLHVDAEKYMYSYDVDWNNDGVFDDTGITDSITHILSLIHI